MVRCRDCSHYNRINRVCGVLKKALPSWWNPDGEIACTPFDERKPKPNKEKAN